MFSYDYLLVVFTIDRVPIKRREETELHSRLITSIASDGLWD